MTAAARSRIDYVNLSLEEVANDSNAPIEDLIHRRAVAQCDLDNEATEGRFVVESYALDSVRTLNPDDDTKVIRFQVVYKVLTDWDLELADQMAAIHSCLATRWEHNATPVESDVEIANLLDLSNAVEALIRMGALDEAVA